MNSYNKWSIAYRLRVKYFSKIIVVSNAIKANKTFKAIDPNKIETIYNTVDKEQIIKLAGNGVKERYDLIFCGRLEDVKQPLDFIDIISKIKGTDKTVKAVMVGDGSLRSNCEIRISDLGLHDNIDMVGFQENPYKYIKSSKFLVITSRDEGFGLVAAEASILGTVVMAYSHLGAIREVLDNFIEGKDTISLAMRYLTLASSNEAYNNNMSTVSNTSDSTPNIYTGICL